MRIQKIAYNYYAVSRGLEYFYGSLEQALNEALMYVWFGKQGKMFETEQSHIDNIPEGFNNEGDHI